MTPSWKSGQEQALENHNYRKTTAQGLMVRLNSCLPIEQRINEVYKGESAVCNGCLHSNLDKAQESKNSENEKSICKVE